MHYIIFDSSDPCVFESAGRFISFNHPFHPRRILSSAVLLLGYSGSYPIAQAGRKYQLEPDSFMVLFPGQEHYGYEPASDGQSHFWCHVQIPGNYRIVESETVPETDACILPEFGRLPHTEKICILFNQLIDAANSSTGSSVLRQNICNSYASILLNSISASYQTNHPSSEHPPQSRIFLAEKIREWIHLHHSEPISSLSISQSLKYNSDYLNHVLTSVTGHTLSETITQIRLQEAEILLLNSDMKISEIAYSVGFTDAKYFMKVFKKAKQVTPSEYRQAHFRLHLNRN